MGLWLHLFLYIRIMQKEKVLQLIDEKLNQIEEAEKVNIWKGKLSFGVHQHVYKDSPYLPVILKKRKGINRRILIATFAIPVIVLLFEFSYGDWQEESIWKTVVKLLLSSLFTGGIFIYGMLLSLVNDTNSAQKEVKKLMLHDLRQKVEAIEVNEKEVQKTGAGFA